VRRLVCFAEAVFSGTATVEGVTGRRADAHEARALLEAPAPDALPVLVDPEARSLEALAPAVLVEGRMLKRRGDVTPDRARLVIGIGPGLAAPRDVHAVVETQRGPTLGCVIWDGTAQADTGTPAAIAGVGEGRVLRAPCAGRFRGEVAIGALVRAETTVGAVDETPVVAPISGRIRGLVAPGLEVEAGMKLGDIDPRGQVDPARISDKARAVAAGVLEAVCVGLRTLALAALAAGLLQAPSAWAGKTLPPPPLPVEHKHPSGAFTFRTPEGWTVKPVEGIPGAVDAAGNGVIVRFHYREGEIGYDSLHVECMLERLAPAFDMVPQVKYEYDFLSGDLGSRRALDSAFVVTYDHPIDGQTQWRQRNLTLVGSGQSICFITYVPVPLWKKNKSLRVLVDAVLGSVTFPGPEGALTPPPSPR
jgi:xanthine dehydrogenase accessory factor